MFQIYLDKTIKVPGDKRIIFNNKNNNNHKCIGGF